MGQGPYPLLKNNKSPTVYIVILIIRQDREEGNGGGCVALVKQGVPYRTLGKGRDQEHVVVEVWCREKEAVIINYYNPYI